MVNADHISGKGAKKGGKYGFCPPSSVLFFPLNPFVYPQYQNSRNSHFFKFIDFQGSDYISSLLYMGCEVVIPDVD